MTIRLCPTGIHGKIFILIKQPSTLVHELQGN